MVSRRKLLAALGVSVAGLAGCQDRDGTPEETPPDTRETAPQPSPTGTRRPTASPAPSATASAEPTAESTASPTTATPDPLADRFGTIHDVTDEGADPTGEERVDGTLQSLVDDDTLLRFPPGTYRLSDLAVEGVSNFGMVGTDATLQLERRGRAIFFGFRRVSDVLVDGFTIDNTASNTAAWFDLRCTGGTNVVRNYTVAGFVDVTSRTNGFTVMVEGGDTSLELDSVDLGQGAIGGAATYAFPRREFYDTSRAAGSLTFRDCVMKGWGIEGLYASPHEGPLRVVGGEYANNALVQVRVGGGNAPERTVIRDVTVRVDGIPDYTPVGSRVLRGIWLKEGDRALVENCDVSLSNLDRSRTPGALVVNDQFGRATIRDCTFTTENVSRPAIVVKRPATEYDPDWMPSLDRLPPEWGVTVENVSVQGSSPNTETIRVDGRNGCRFSNVAIEKSGAGVDGLFLRNVGQCVLEDGTMSTSRYPVVLDFDGDDDCVLELSNVSLTGRNLDGTGDSISSNGDGTYCVGSDALPGSGRDGSDRLALTRTTDLTTTDTPAPDEGDGSRLYGRWLED